jgi:hypothetical protein
MRRAMGHRHNVDRRRAFAYACCEETQHMVLTKHVPDLSRVCSARRDGITR